MRVTMRERAVSRHPLVHTSMMMIQSEWKFGCSVTRRMSSLSSTKLEHLHKVRDRCVSLLNEPEEPEPGTWICQPRFMRGRSENRKHGSFPSWFRRLGDHGNYANFPSLSSWAQIRGGICCLRGLSVGSGSLPCRKNHSIVTVLLGDGYVRILRLGDHERDRCS